MPKVLLVEDFEDSRAYYAELLGEHGFEVVLAVDGQEALAAAEREQPDVIVMDLGLPRLDGWQTTRALKANAELRDVPVVALTSHLSEQDQAKAREAGCVTVLGKPVLPKRLLATLGELTAQPA